MTHRERLRRIHICMKEPCTYCAARSNARHPPDSVSSYAELMTAVANELRLRTVRSLERPAPRPRKKRRP